MINSAWIAYRFEEVTIDGKTLDRIVFNQITLDCEWKNNGIIVEKFTKNDLNSCLNTIPEALNEFNKMYTARGGNLNEIPLTESQIQDTEELAALYLEFIWGGVLPVATMIFVFALIIKILKNIVSIGEI